MRYIHVLQDFWSNHIKSHQLVIVKYTLHRKKSSFLVMSYMCIFRQGNWLPYHKLFEYITSSGICCDCTCRIKLFAIFIRYLCKWVLLLGYVRVSQIILNVMQLKQILAYNLFLFFLVKLFLDKSLKIIIQIEIWGNTRSVCINWEKLTNHFSNSVNFF